MSSFAGIGMSVFPVDGRWPLPSVGDDGIARYRARVRLDSSADYSSLAATRSLVTMKRASASFAGTAVVDAGIGAATLSVPVALGTPGSFDAILVRLDPAVDAKVAGRFDADCEWVVVSDPAP